MNQTLTGNEDTVNTCFFCGFVGGEYEVGHGDYYDPNLKHDVFGGWVCKNSSRCLDREQVKKQTLKAVGEWLKTNVALWTKIGLDGGASYVLTLSPQYVLNAIQALKEGRMPGEV